MRPSIARAACAILGVAALGAAAWLWSREPAPPPHRPNIVVLMWDTCRADRLSAYGHRVDTTPWLREFAKDAVLYQRAYSSSPTTPPAHASLFTGLLPIRHGLKQGMGDRVAPGIPLLATTLRSAGYETVGFTANSFISPSTGLDGGFDRMVPLYDAERGLGKADRVLGEVERWLAERARTPARERAKPVFLFVNFMDMHLPRTPFPEDLLAVTLPDGPAPGHVVQALGVDSRAAAAHMFGIRRMDDGILGAMATVYDGAARFLDRHTGLLVERLRAAGILDDALLTVVSDHGEHLGEHGNLSHEMSLRGEVLRIPMVVRWPGRLDGGRVEPAQVRLMDLYPTILEAAAVPMPPRTGRDAETLTTGPIRPRLLRAAFHRPTAFLPVVKDAFAGVDPVHFDRFHVSIHGVQDPSGPRGTRKFLLYARGGPDREPVTEREELFDLDADPGETRDLLEGRAPEDLAEADRLRALIQR